MPEVPTQTITPPAPEVQPGGQPTATVTPTGDTALPTPNSSAASETPVNGAGRGVDLELITDSEKLQLAIDGLDFSDLPDSGELDGAIPTPGATPAAAQTATPAPAAVPAPASAATPAPAAAPENALTKPGELPRNLKAVIRDDVDFHVQTLIKDARLSGTPLSYAEAEAKALQTLGRAPAAPAAAQPTPGEAPTTPSPAPAPQKSPNEELQGKLDAAYADYQVARNAFDEVKEVDSLRLINQLERQLTFAAAAETQQQQTRQQQELTQFDKDWDIAVSRTQQMYPDAANPESTLSQRAAEIQAAYGSSNDPAHTAIYNSANSVLFFYQQAALDLQVAPSATPAPAQISTPKPTPQPAPPNQAPPMSALLAGGNSGLSPAAPPGFNVETITDSHTLEEVIARMGS